MTTITEPEKTLERAISDYLAVSRSAHLYELGEYAKAEQDAWEQLEAAREGVSLDSHA